METMRFILAIILTSIILLAPVKAQNKIEDHYDRLTIQDNLHLSTDSSDDRVYFTLGDSLQQREEADKQRQLALERLRQTSNQRSQTSYGTSSGGYGQATIISKDTQYFNCVSYAKAQTGINRPIGAGGRAGVNSHEAKEGVIGVERGRVHAVVVRHIEGDNITVTESNFYRGYITQRTLHRSDFIGFII